MKSKSKLVNEYLAFIIRTRQSQNLDGPKSLMDCLENIIALSNEVGELQGHYKKYLRDKRHLDPKLLRDELGDVLYSVVYQIYLTGFSVDEVIEANIEKLKQKWGME